MRFHPGLLAGLLIPLSACSGESTGSSASTMSSTGSSASTTSSTGGDGGAGAFGSTTVTGAGGAGAGGSGGGTPGEGACPTGQFPAEKQIVFESSGGAVASDTTWTKDNLYIVNVELAVQGLLTIEAGTTVCFGSTFSEKGTLVVAPQGTGGLDVQGTSAEHVTFTAVDSGKGWAGILVLSGAEKLAFAYTDFYYASASDDFLDDHYSHGAVRISDGTFEAAPQTRLHHVTFSGLKRGGALWLSTVAGLTADSVIEVKSFDVGQEELAYVDSAVLVSLNAAQSLAPGMISIATEIPESKAGVELLREHLDGSAVLPAIDLPYLAPAGVFLTADSGGDTVSLTLSAGVEIRMGGGASVQVGAKSGFITKANLIVDGTAEKPVVLRYYPFPVSFSPFKSWGGLAFVSYDPAVSKVSHAILQLAGEGLEDVPTACNKSETGAIVIDAPGLSDYAGLVIDHTAIEGSASHGIVAHCDLECINPATDYQDPALGNTFVNVAGQPQILAACPP